MARARVVVAAAACVCWAWAVEVGGGQVQVHEQPDGPLHGGLLGVIDNWMTALKANQAVDESTTQEQLGSVQAEIDSQTANKTALQQSILTDEAVAAVYAENEIWVNRQRRDAVALRPAAEHLVTHVQSHCGPAVQERVERDRKRLVFAEQLTDYVMNALASSRKADHAAFATAPPPPPPSLAQGRRALHTHSLLGLSAHATAANASADNRTRKPRNTTASAHDCTVGDAVYWGDKKRQHCCSKLGVGCDSGTTTSLEKLHTVLIDMQHEFSEHVRRLEAMSIDMAASCIKRTARVLELLATVNGTCNALQTELMSTSARYENINATQAALQARLASVDGFISDRNEQVQVITHSSALRKKARTQELFAISQIRRMLLTFGSTGYKPPPASSGRSQSAAARTCHEIKVYDPTAQDGLYWIHLGEGSEAAFEAYCDMTTDGGGWTLVQKQVFGKGGTFGPSKQTNGSQPIVYPTWVASERISRTNQRALDFFASRSHHQWLKTLALHRPPYRISSSTGPPFTEAISQTIKLTMGPMSMSDLMAAVGSASSGNCTRLDAPVRVATSRPHLTKKDGEGEEQQQQHGFDHPVVGHVDHEAGQTSYITSVLYGSTGNGLAADTASAFDRCGVPVSRGCDEGELVCDFQGLTTAGATADEVTAVDAGRLVASVLSNTCVFKCPGLAFPDRNTELYVWAVRPESCPEDQLGNVCGGEDRGTCMDGVCKCEYGFDGKDCTQKICPDECVHGSCNNDGACECEAGWLGVACDVPVQCPKPEDDIKHGTVACSLGHKDVAAVGSTCTYSCDEGYRHASVDHVTLRRWPTSKACEEHGPPVSTVTVEVGRCTAIEGGQQVSVSAPNELGAVEVAFYLNVHEGCNGSPIESRTIPCGSMCEPIGLHPYAVSCAGGADKVRICEGAPVLAGQVQSVSPVGNWSGPEPSCVVDGCPILPDPDHGTVQCSGNQEGDTCQSRCNVGYRLLGTAEGRSPEVSQCTQGSWNPAPSTCTKRDCGTPEPGPHTGYECEGSVYGSLCALSCDAGYEPTPAAPMEIKCDGDGNWEAYDPNPCQLSVDV